MSAVGSSCNSLLFSLIFAPLLSLHIFWHSQGWMMGRQDGIKIIHKRECDQKTREFHELLYTEIARLLDSSLVKLTCCNLVNYCIKKCSFFSAIGYLSWRGPKNDFWHFQFRRFQKFGNFFRPKFSPILELLLRLSKCLRRHFKIMSKIFQICRIMFADIFCDDVNFLTVCHNVGVQNSWSFDFCTNHVVNGNLVTKKRFRI